MGAYHGEFAETCLSIWPKAELVLFEALQTKIPALKSRFYGKKVSIIEGIVGDCIKETVTYFSDETASSVLESEAIYAEKQIITQKMSTLDSYINDSNSKTPNFLKIDTQGYEFQILKGIENNLSKVEVILLELNFIEIYFNVKLAHEVISFLSDHNFVMYDICEIHRRPLDQALFQIDFLFVPRNAPFRADKKWDVKKI